MSPRVFLTAEWRDLALLTFAADQSVLIPHLPPGLELDLWDGRAFASLVGFQFLHTSVLGVPAWPWRDFPEVNLRFYVRRRAREGPRRGVVFVKEIVPHRMVAWIARTLYGENYVSLPMRTTFQTGRRAEYSWQHAGAENRFSVMASDQPFYPQPGSIEDFILDHHWGYSRSRRGECVEYFVDRPAWRIFPVTGHTIRIDTERAYGTPFARALDAQPISAILAEGSPISVSFGRTVTGSPSD